MNRPIRTEKEEEESYQLLSLSYWARRYKDRAAKYQTFLLKIADPVAVRGEAAIGERTGLSGSYYSSRV